jgi:polar amino acid transport system substrate-binding protein
MSQWQSLCHVVLPQAFTFILPPLTNDFIALLKDSSLVSLITIVELAKTYTIIASNSLDFFGTGAIVALIYFLIGLPFVRLARLAERHLRLEKRAYSSRKVARM